MICSSILSMSVSPAAVMMPSTWLGIVKRHLPGKGQVRALMVTEKQYVTMQILLGKPTIAEKETGCQEMLVL